MVVVSRCADRHLVWWLFVFSSFDLRHLERMYKFFINRPIVAMVISIIPAGLPSSLLERRPDVREAEQLLRSANAQIGESIAEFFPRIGLTALLGKVSPELSAFTLGNANARGIAASGSGPLFEGGRLVGRYRQARAARDEALLAYKQTALSALRDVSDALITRDRKSTRLNSSHLVISYAVFCLKKKKKKKSIE